MKKQKITNIIPNDYFWDVLPEVQLSAHKWLEEIFEEKNYSSHSVRGYFFDISSFFNWLKEEHLGYSPSHNDLQNLEHFHFRAFFAKRYNDGLLASSRARCLSSLHSYFRWLHKNDYIKSSNINLIQSPKKEKKLPRPISKIDINEIINHLHNLHEESWLNQRDKTLFLTLYGCGLRISEALNLNIDDIPNLSREMKNLRIIGKGNKERLVPLLPIVHQEIWQLIKVTPFRQQSFDPLFYGQKGNRLQAGVVQKLLRNIRKMLDLPDSVTPHAFRHSFATHLLEGEPDLRSLQQLLGHSSLRSTQRYTEIDSKKTREKLMALHPRASANT